MYKLFVFVFIVNNRYKINFMKTIIFYTDEDLNRHAKRAC